MSQRYVHSLTGFLVIAIVATVVAAGRSAESTGSPNPVQQSIQCQPEQHEIQQTSAAARVGQKLQKTGLQHVAADRALDRDNDRLQELEKELAEEQLNYRVRDRSSLQEKK